MNKSKKTYHFLGSVYFAIILIASAALFVIVGTFIESLTDSHLFAAYFTYQSPLFALLIWGFFINILFSSLRRWPFKTRHLPFLITHLGLLMILSGVIIKGYYGLQGTMGVMEGSSSQEIFLANSYVIRLDSPDRPPEYIELKKTIFGNLSLAKQPPDINLGIVDYKPNSYERLETWIKNGKGFISGIKPFPLHEISENDQKIPVSHKAQFTETKDLFWNIFAVKTHDVTLTKKQIYLQSLQLKIFDTLTSKLIYSGPFIEHLNLPQGSAKIDLDLSQIPHLVINLNNDIIQINLAQNSSLASISLNHSHLGSPAITIDIEQNPFLAFLEDAHSDVCLFACDSYGRIYTDNISNETLTTYVMYNDGFAGYAVQAKIPLADTVNRITYRQGQLQALENQLRNNLQNSTLSTPLLLLQQACAKCNTDFSHCCIQFLDNWNNTSSWFYPAERIPPADIQAVLKQINWQTIPSNELKALYWTHRIFQRFGPELEHTKDPLEFLLQHGWPLTAYLKSDLAQEDVLKKLVEQIFAISDQLPEIDSIETSSDILKARLFSIYLRMHDIHLSQIPLPEKANSECVHLECPLTARQFDETPTNKLEENLPKITLKVTDIHTTDWITLTFDRYGQGLKWPILNGKYKIRFQPNFISIPYNVRLRNARQINYANSSQPYSFESDIIVRDLQNSTTIDKTVSMNNVHESWDGYRFYLSNISPATETAVKRVQLAVNYDPIKYWLTYPGALILTLGIFLVFRMSPRKQEQKGQ